MRKREEKVTDRESGRERVKDVGRGRVRKRGRVFKMIYLVKYRKE